MTMRMIASGRLRPLLQTPPRRLLRPLPRLPMVLLLIPGVGSDVSLLLAAGCWLLTAAWSVLASLHPRTHCSRAFLPQRLVGARPASCCLDLGWHAMSRSEGGSSQTGQTVTRASPSRCAARAPPSLPSTRRPVIDAKRPKLLRAFSVHCAAPAWLCRIALSCLMI